jgi:hypothetical protein
VDSLLPAPPALAGVRPPDKGLGGKLEVRIPRGGCGNALMLIVFLIVLPAAFTPGVGFDFRRLLLPVGLGVVGFGSCDDDGTRKPLFGRLGVDSTSDTVDTLPRLFRVLVVGSAGSADVGGPYEGLDGLGREAAMVTRMLDGEFD